MKLTKREIYETAIAMLEDVEGELKVGEETVTVADLTAALRGLIEGLDKTNAARAAKVAEKAAEKDAEKAPIKEALVGVMSATEFKTASTLIAEAGLEIKPQAVPSLLKSLVADGTVVKGDVKVKGKGKHIGYGLAQ